MKQKMIQANIIIKARDYASFEDLTEELGICIVDCKFVESKECNAPAKRSKGYKRHDITADAVAKYHETAAKYPNWSQVKIGGKAGLPYGSATLSRIHRGEYDHLLQE